MSDIKTDKQLQEMVAEISRKINGAAALNGGFDRMMVVVEHIQKNQQETSETLGKIHDGLYDPQDGLYIRMKVMEKSAEEFGKKLDAHFAADEKAARDLNENLKQMREKSEKIDRSLDDKVATTTRLKKIAGEDLEKLDAVIKSRAANLSLGSKIFWILGGGLLAAVGKTIWELIIRR